MRAFSEHQTLGIEWLCQAPLLSGYTQQEPTRAPHDFPGTPFFSPTPLRSTARPDSNQQSNPLQNLEMQMQAYAREHQALIERVRESYVFDHEPSIRDLFSEHRAIPQILLEAAHHLNAAFGNDRVFVLRTSIPDAGPRTMYAVVMWPGSVSDVRQALDTFDNQWWLSRAHRASGHLTFTYELA